MKATVLLTTLACAVLALASTAVINAADKEGDVTKLFPVKLHDADGKEVSADQLKGKVVGIYFSAHWCPPCRTFTPGLVKFRDDHQEEFEIVFASLDNSEKEKEEYIDEAKMKWLSLPGSRSDEINALAEKYGVRGIPSLIILDPEGNTITPNGRSDVSSDPKGALAKWKAAISS